MSVYLYLRYVHLHVHNVWNYEHTHVNDMVCVYYVYVYMHAILDIHNYNTMGIISAINVARRCDCIVNIYNTHCIAIHIV